MPQDQRKKLFSIIWKKTPKDYRGLFEGKKVVMSHFQNGFVCEITMSEEELLKRAKVEA